jgi:hypothetical protein
MKLGPFFMDRKVLKVAKKYQHLCGYDCDLECFPLVIY